MSSSLLKIIPDNTAFVPEQKRQLKAKKFLERKFSCEIEIEVYENVEFIDQGENLETIICPNCESRNEIDYFTENDPIIEWWNEISDKSSFPQNTVLMPCCSITVDAISLTYDWPAGYSKFEITLIEPDPDNLNEGKLKPKHLRKLQSLLGSDLIEIQAHY